MKGKSATVTTHKIIQELIKNKKVNMVKDDNNSQVHHLFINDKNQFNKIDKNLCLIENNLDKVRKRARLEANMLDLQLLLLNTYGSIYNERDSRLLYQRIIRLMFLLTNKKIRKNGQFVGQFLDLT